MEERNEIGFKIRCISNMIRRKLDVTFTEPEFDGLTGVQNAMMHYIMEGAKERDVFQRELEKEFSLRRSSVTVMLQNLEQKGYIRRIPVSSDARLKKIVLTEKAEKMQERVEAELTSFHRKLEAGFTEEEKEQFLFLLEKLRQNLTK